MTRCTVIHLCKDFVMLHLVGEVTAVKLDLQDGLVEVLKLRQCEYIR